MSKRPCSFIIIPPTVLVLGCFLTGSLSPGADIDPVSSANEPRNVTPGVAQPKSPNNVPSQIRVVVPADPTASQVKAAPGLKSGLWKKSGNQIQKPPASAKTNTFNPQLPAQPTSKLRVEVKEIQALQRARAEAPVKQSQAEELREQLRETLRMNRAAPALNQRETMVDTKQRAADLKIKLRDHKEALDEALLSSKDRNRRGIDQAGP